MTLSEVDAWYYPIANLTCPICKTKKLNPEFIGSRKITQYRTLLLHIGKNHNEVFDLYRKTISEKVNEIKKTKSKQKTKIVWEI